MIVRVSGTLLRYTEYRKEIEIEAATLRDAVDGLVASYPDLRKILFARDGRLRATHRIFVNGEPATEADAERPLGRDDQLDVVTAVSGG